MPYTKVGSARSPITMSPLKNDLKPCMRCHPESAEWLRDQVIAIQDITIYNKAFYRSVFVGAENSVGFHNPTEAMRILGDAAAFATKAEGLLRQALAKAGVDVPVKVDLELYKYLGNRCEKKLKGNPNFEFKGPTGVHYKL